MNRKSKLIFSLISLCFSIAVLCFGVYSALSVSYSINGSVSYEINDVFVELDLSVYRALSTTPVNSATHNQNVSTIKDAGDNISETDFGKLSYTDHKSTYEDGVVKPGNEDGIFEADSPDLDLTYGSPTNDNQGYAFYIVIDIHNLGSEIINAQITAPTSLENTILRDSGNVEITADSTERIVLGLALDDVTTGITSAGFTYTITISRGELPLEEITDMSFTIDIEEATKAVTLTSYTGTGGDVVIPETIGYDTVSSKTLTFKTMEDMSSDPMNEYYFYQDLYITLPNQEAQFIENPKLWLNENMPTIQATPEDYFPMTIQTVDSYTINQEDYNQYAELDQSILSDIVVAPFASMGVKGSVDVQFGTEEKSFTFNMETVEAALGGDSSPTSIAILEFMSKAESDPESLLPVTYTNLEYSVLVEGDEYIVTSIGSRAFSSQDNIAIRNLYIPNTITSIESYAFGHYNVTETSIENIYAEDLDTLLNMDYGFTPSDQAHSGDSVISYVNPFCIAENIYVNGEPLEEITIEEGLTEIKAGTLAGLNGVKTINIPSSVTIIGGDAFNGAAPEKVNITDIDAWAMINFRNSASNPLSSVTDLYLNGELVPKLTLTTATKISPYAFSDCGSFTSITIPSSVTSIGYNAFYGCSALETVTFGANSQLESIWHHAFQNCSNLTSIEIPNNVTSIEGYTFYGCSSLTSIEIPSNVTSIGDYTFYGCSSLTSIEIPSNVTRIGERAFMNCDALKTVTFEDIITEWTVYTGYGRPSYTITSENLQSPSTMATYLTDTYDNYPWTKE